MKKKPKEIKHIGKTRERIAVMDQMLADFAEIMALTDNEASLLRAYCMCGYKFTPTVQYLQKETGLPRKTVFNVRKTLRERRIIVETPHDIYIRWNDYFAMCMADQTMMTRRQTYKERKAIKLGYLVADLVKYMSDDEILEAYMDESKLVDVLARTTTAEAKTFIQRLKKLLHPAELIDWKFQSAEDLFNDSFGDKENAMASIDYSPLNMYEPLPF